MNRFRSKSCSCLQAILEVRNTQIRLDQTLSAIYYNGNIYGSRSLSDTVVQIKRLQFLRLRMLLSQYLHCNVIYYDKNLLELYKSIPIFKTDVIKLIIRWLYFCFFLFTTIGNSPVIFRAEQWSSTIALQVLVSRYIRRYKGC